MPNTSESDLPHFVRGLDAATLATVLLDLAADHDVVRERLLRLQLRDDPTRLAVRFRARLDAWRNETEYHDWRRVGAYAASIEQWVFEVEKEVLPVDPSQARQLAEALIEIDGKLFESVDDSGNDIGEAIGAACRLWLRAAADDSPPEGGWADRLIALVDADQYGARQTLLDDAEEFLGTVVQAAISDRLDRRGR